jgi:transglutaminase-like putative cysteine protease
MLRKLKLDEGWSSFCILALMVLSTFWSVSSGGLVKGLGIVSWAVICGLVVGLALAKSRIPRVLAHLLAVGVGVGWVALLASSLLPSNQALPGRLAELQMRLAAWSSQVATGDVSTDSFIFALGVISLGYLVSYFSAWFVFRTHWVWGAIFPTGALILLNVYYAPPRLVIYLVFYLILALLLIITSHTYLRHEEWRREHVLHSDTIGLVFLRHGALFSTFLVLAIWLAPISTAGPTLQELGQQFDEPWRRIQREWNRLFSSLSYDEGGGTHSFGQMMSLSGAASLSSIPVMDVTASEPHYWRAVVLDRYTGTGWMDTTSTSVRPRRGDALPFQGTPYLLRHEITQTVTVARHGQEVLFGAGQPIATSTEAQIHFTLLPGGNPIPQELLDTLASAVATGEVAQSVWAETLASTVSSQGSASSDSSEELPMGDISILYAPGALRDGTSYEMVSSVSRASESILRGAPQRYPGWISQRYLQLPENLPSRVRNLALEITALAENPYDKAAAIEAYLRRIPYDLSIDAPPTGRDAVDWFLFDNRRGYCDYYASAMVVLCRAAGLPARLAQGYAVGEYESSVDGFRVRESDAHTWPEVYFTYFGWIEFEPTSAQPLIERFAEEDEGGIEPWLGSLLTSVSHDDEEKFGLDEEVMPTDEIEDIVIAESRPWWRTALLPVAIVGPLAVLLAAVVLVWYRRLRGLSPAEGTYARMTYWLSLVGVQPESHQTPSEFAEGGCSIVPSARERFQGIVKLYVKEHFSHHTLSEDEEERLIELWKGTWWLVLRRVWTLRQDRARRRRARAYVSPGELRPL